MAEVPELTPVAFRRRWPQGCDGNEVVLIDVREPHELAIASLAGALHIPMSQIPQRLAELDPRKPTVVMCHVGGRSRRVAQFLEVAGFEQVFNLRGGIDAWSQMDPDVPRY